MFTPFSVGIYQLRLVNTMARALSIIMVSLNLFQNINKVAGSNIVLSRANLESIRKECRARRSSTSITGFRELNIPWTTFA